MQRRPNQLHIISTDRLLWVLGGFAPCVFATSEPRARREPCEALEAWQIKRIAELARRPKHSKNGAVAAFAEKSGISRGSVSVMIFNVRRGRAPRYWKEVLRAA